MLLLSLRLIWMVNYFHQFFFFLSKKESRILGNGTVSYFEFLLILMAFRERDGEDDPTAKFYFELFDEDASEEISRDEFKDIISHLLVDTLGGVVSDEELVSNFLITMIVYALRLFSFIFTADFYFHRILFLIQSTSSTTMPSPSWSSNLFSAKFLGRLRMCIGGGALAPIIIIIATITACVANILTIKTAVECHYLT